MYTMKDFREKKIAVRVGQKHVKEFLQMCEEEGLRWVHGEKATEFFPYKKYGDDLAISANAQFAGFLMFGCVQGFREYYKNTIVDFEDFIHPSPTHYKITIECDGTTTTARMEVNGRAVKARQTKRNPADKFSWRVGAETAFCRLWDEKVKTKPDKAVREVKRPAKVGEWVKIVNRYGSPAKKYENGDIRKVNRLAGSGGSVFLDGETYGTYLREYVVLEGYKPENK